MRNVIFIFVLALVSSLAKAQGEEQVSPCRQMFKATAVVVPNSETNNCFKVELEQAVFKYELNVFNRWGELVFESKDSKECWNLEHKENKKQVTDGTYFYTVKLKRTEESEELSCTGYFTVIKR